MDTQNVNEIIVPAGTALVGGVIRHDVIYQPLVYASPPSRKMIDKQPNSGGYVAPPNKIQPTTPTQPLKKLIIPTPSAIKPTTTSMTQNIIRNTMYGSGSLSSRNVHGNSVASNISRALKTQGLSSNVTSSLTAAQNKVRQAMLPSTSSSQRSSLFASAQKDLITAHASMGNRRI